jgi:hypothetical protein
LRSLVFWVFFLVCLLWQKRRAWFPRYLPICSPLISLDYGRESAIFGAGIIFFWIDSNKKADRIALHRIALHRIALEAFPSTYVFSFVIIPLHITSPKFSRRKIVLGGGKERGSHLFYYTTHFLRYHGHLGSAPSIHNYIPAYVYFYLRCKTYCFF